MPAPSDDEPLARLRTPGDTPEHDEYRARLYTCAVEGDGEGARVALAEMEAAGFRAIGDDHLLVLVADQLRGRAEEAEAYLRAMPRAAMTTAHLASVLSAYALGHRADDAERLYREFEAGPLTPDHECRMALLTALSFARDHVRAREWFEQFSVPDDSPVHAEALAHLIGAHGHPGALDDLVVLHEGLDADDRGDARVAAALVSAFADAGAPERAEACLEAAVDAVGDDDARTDLVHVCIHAYRRQVLPAIERLVDFAEERELDVGYPSRVDPMQGRWL